MTAADVNPFATRYTRLGAIDPLTEEGRPFDAVGHACPAR